MIISFLLLHYGNLTFKCVYWWVAPDYASLTHNLLLVYQTVCHSLNHAKLAAMQGEAKKVCYFCTA
ncbi:MAG: hypothetical protein ACP5F6_04815 [Microbacter sp.]